MQSAIDEATDAIVALGPKVVVSGHGPTERKDPVGMLNMIRRIGGMPTIHMPDQQAFEQMLAGGPS
jgi:hypothetical protein